MAGDDMKSILLVLIVFCCTVGCRQQSSPDVDRLVVASSAGLVSLFAVDITSARNAILIVNEDAILGKRLSFPTKWVRYDILLDEPIWRELQECIDEIGFRRLLSKESNVQDGIRSAVYCHFDDDTEHAVWADEDADSKVNQLLSLLRSEVVEPIVRGDMEGSISSGERGEYEELSKLAYFGGG